MAVQGSITTSAAQISNNQNEARRTNRKPLGKASIPLRVWVEMHFSCCRGFGGKEMPHAAKRTIAAADPDA